MVCESQKQSSLQKCFKKLIDSHKVYKGKITAFGTEMLSVIQTSLKEIERLQTDIVTTNKVLEMLPQCVMHMKLITNTFIQKIRKLNKNANSIHIG